MRHRPMMGPSMCSADIDTAALERQITGEASGRSTECLPNVSGDEGSELATLLKSHKSLVSVALPGAFEEIASCETLVKLWGHT